MELARSTAAKLLVDQKWASWAMNDMTRESTPQAESELYLTLQDGRYVNQIYAGDKLR